jgi:hypothetical protein
MEYEKHEQVKDIEHDEIILGRSSWDRGADASVKYAWRDVRDRRARGGEIPLYALRQAVRFAARENYLDPAETVGLIKDLADTLLARSASSAERVPG